MDAASQPAARRVETLHAVPSLTPAAESPRTLKVVVNYRLSEAGRKASLLNGGNGRARQSATLTVPVTRLHLVLVEPDGTARLKLRPQYRLNAEQRIVRVNLPPAYDQPPTLDDLLQDAARNHELERGFYAQHTTARVSRREQNQQWLDEVAGEFLADPTRRAVPHPAPTARLCQIATSRGSIAFHARHMTGLAAKVPLEAFRRYLNDLRIRNGRAELQRERDVQIDAERRQMMHEWIAAHGTSAQQERLAAGVLPKPEWVGLVADHTFAALQLMPVFEPAGPATLQAFLRQHAGYEAAVVASDGLRVVTRLLTDATAVQWAWMKWVRHVLPDAQVQLRTRQIAWKADARAPWYRAVTLLVTTRVGVLTLRREFVVPDTAPAGLERIKEEAGCPSA